MKPLLRKPNILKTVVLSIMLLHAHAIPESEPPVKLLQTELVNISERPVSNRMLDSKDIIRQLTSPYTIIGDFCFDTQINDSEYELDDCFEEVHKVADSSEEYLNKMWASFQSSDGTNGKKTQSTYEFKPLKVTQMNTGEYKIEASDPNTKESKRWMHFEDSFSSGQKIDEKLDKNQFVLELMKMSEFKHSFSTKESLLKHLLKTGRCESALRAFKISISADAHFILVFVIQPKPKGNNKAVMAVKTAAIFWKPSEEMDSSIVFTEREVKSTREVEALLDQNNFEFGQIFKVSPQGKLGNKYLAVEINTQVFFDRNNNSQASSACQHAFVSVKKVLDLFRMFKINDFQLKTINDEGEDDSFQNLKQRTKRLNYLTADVNSEGIDTQLKRETTTKNEELEEEFRSLRLAPTRMTPSKTGEIPKGSESTVGIKSFFTPSNFLKLIKMAMNTLRWRELSRLWYYVYSRYAEFEFEHFEENDDCQKDQEYTQPKVVILTSEGKRMMAVSFIISEPKPDEQQKNTAANDSNTHICMEISAQLSLSSLSRTFCYSLEVDSNGQTIQNQGSESDPDQHDFTLWKMMRFFVGNYADVVEELCMFLKTRLRPASFRKYFYHLGVNSASTTGPGQSQSLLHVKELRPDILNQLDDDSPSEAQLNEVESLRKTDSDLLLVKADTAQLSQRLRMKVALPTHKAHSENSDQVRLFSVDIEVLEMASESFLLKMKSFNRNLEIEVGKYWIEDVLLLQSNEEHLKSLQKHVWRSWVPAEEHTRMNEMLFAFFKDTVGEAVSGWVGEFFEEDTGADSTAPGESTDPVFTKAFGLFERSQCNSFPVTASVIFYTMMAFGFYDKDLNEHLLGSKDLLSANDNNAGERDTLEQLKVRFQTVARNRVSGLNPAEPGSEGEEVNVLSEEKIAQYQSVHGDLLKTLLPQLTFLDERDQLGSVLFVFKPSEASMGRENEHEFPDEVQVKLTFFEDFFWNSVHLKVDTAFFAVEYLFAAQSFPETFFYVGKALSEVLDQQSRRFKMSGESLKTYVVAFDDLVKRIDDFLKDKKGKFCKLNDGGNRVVYRTLPLGEDGLGSGVFEPGQDGAGAECSAAKSNAKDPNSSYFELSEDKVEKPNKDPLAKTNAKKKKAFLLNFVFKPTRAQPTQTRLFSSSYQFFSRYDYDYLEIVDMYLKRGLFHLGLLGPEEVEGTENHLVKSKLGYAKSSTSDARKLRTDQSTEESFSEALETLAGPNHQKEAQFLIRKLNQSGQLRQGLPVISKMKDSYF